jgi:hypothetical protein
MLDYPISDDVFYNNALKRGLGANIKFVWLPKRCALTGKLLWLTHAYKVTAMWTGPGETIFEHKWHSKNEHILWLLKR